MTQGQAPLTDLIIHLMRLPMTDLNNFTRKDARQWMDQGISEEVIRRSLKVERVRRR